MDSLQRSTIKPAEVKNGIQPPRKTSLTSPQSIKVKQADVMKFTAKSSPQKCKSSLRQNSTSKPSNCSGKSKLALPSSRLPSKSIDNTKSPRLAKREKHSPPKRKRISSAGSEGSISDTCSVSSDVSDCSTTSTGIPGKRLQHKPSLKSSSLKQPIARGYRNPKPFYSTGSESSVDSSNTTLNGSMCKEPTAVKKSSSLVTPGYRQSLIKPGVLPQKKTIPVCRPLKMSTAGSKLSKPQPVKATVPMTHSKTPNKVVNKGTPRPNLSQTQAITSTPKSQRLPRRLPSPVSSVKSASAKTTLPRRPVSANNDRMQCSPMKSEIRKTNVTPQSSRNRRSAIPTPAKSIGKFKLDFSAGLSPSSLQSPVLRKISLADSTYDSVFSEEAEIVPPLPPPSFSPPALTKSENPVFSSPVLCDVNTQDGLPPPHCEEMVKKSIDKQCRNSPAVDTLINISDGNIQNGLSPQICTVSLTKPLIDFGSPLDKENLI
uniref:Serine/arginine repetitive matrix protein 2-like n=1 Tax=Saccoglossus kowalevskii TaxID=10224 RepID=A0ABM0ML11_SACKO|nr:PREDICTED: serine/arginine repetitive matrix protein 2-like [Saccoglossus kowalevskii]